MSMVIIGVSRCWICGELLGIDASKWRAFSAFLTSSCRLHRFSDSAVHEECFARHPDRAIVESLYSEANEILSKLRGTGLSLEEVEAEGRRQLAEFHQRASLI